MRTLTKVEAEASTTYYSEILIGKPITPTGNSNPFKISSLEITKVEEGYIVNCICNISGTIAYSNLEKVIPQLEVLPFEEFLSNLN